MKKGVEGDASLKAKPSPEGRREGVVTSPIERKTEGRGSIFTLRIVGLKLKGKKGTLFWGEGWGAKLHSCRIPCSGRRKKWCGEGGGHGKGG